MKLFRKIKFSKNSIVFLIVLAFIMLSQSCNISKKLEPGHYIVDKIEIENIKETNIEKDIFLSYIRQKPNRKLFRTFHFYVWWYNLFDQEKISRKKFARNEKYDVINAKRIKKNEIKNEKREKKGKAPKSPKLKDKESLIFKESLRDIGEEPVILDSSATEQTRQQLAKFLFSRGHFNGQVKDSVQLDKSGKLATVRYILLPKKPYTIGKITYQMDDEKLGQLIRTDSMNSILVIGQKYNTENLIKERQRLTSLALNNGYYYFENAYLNFDVDSGFANNTVSINIHLKKFSRPFSSSNDSIVLDNHVKYKIGNIYFIPEPVPGNLREVYFKDTLKVKNSDVVFLLNNPMPFRPSVLLANIDIKSGNLFRKDTAEITYRALLGLGIFKNVNIQFFKSRDYRSRLDCYIICNPLIKQSLTAETEGINTSGNLGVDGSLVYQNRNFFKGGELVEIKLQGALIAQQPLTDDEQSTDITEIRNTFNTLQFGPEASFSVPRAFFPFSLFPFRKEMAPHTFVRSSFNYQNRSEFDRTITDIDYGLSFKTHQNQIRHEIIPLEIYFVNSTFKGNFESALKSLNDAFLFNSFVDHITTATRYALTYSSKENSNTSSKPVSYLRVGVQSSGNILRQAFSMTGRTKDSLDRFLIYNIPFAQFLRGDIDYRIYIPIRKKSRVVYRLSGGIGKPLKNLNVLPYEQSFFSGGPNSIRAWRARTLGPGAYDPTGSSTRFDKIGDMILEGNIEYRFHIIKSLNGALFADAGNIWRLQPDPTKPGGEFLVDRFVDQIAMGGGIGIRMDLSFFVLRFDFAAPLRDPKYAVGNRWTFDKQPWKETIVNFGIGYPF
ncbi:MAG: BamA/TamA family outer membrane protein [Sphingobacteriaceae bacterium]|nr:BamA/TamA family outer membrane protein [Sphingobacteriaceae bacterium]